MLAKGIDLSRYNGVGDWGLVHSSGIDFVIIKAGGIYSVTGKPYQDDLLVSHVRGAESVNIPHGLYWYFLPWMPVLPQVELAVSLWKSYGGALPFAVDVESANGTGIDIMTNALRTFITLIQPLVSKVMIYTRRSFWDVSVRSDPLWRTCGLWASRWSSGLTSPWSDGNYQFRDWSNWVFWQYSGDNNAQAKNHGFLNGDPDLDLNYFNGTKDEMRRLFGISNPIPIPVPEPIPEPEPEKMKVEVTASLLNLRDKPMGKILTVLPKGTILDVEHTVIENGDTWHKVTLTGYVSGYWVKKL